MASEKRLIDANELKRIYSIWVGQLQAPEDKGDLNGVTTCLQVLNEQPTVDAVEVVHGYNIDHDTPSLFECSICHWSCWDTYCGDTDEYNYCPNCGAKMDGDGNG